MLLLQAQFQVNDLFTVGSFGTLAGTTFIVYIVCGAIQQAFNYSPKWLALAVAMVISFIAAYIGLEQASNDPETAGKIDKGITYLLAVLNGFLIYMTATGTNRLLSGDQNNEGAAPAHANRFTKRKFNSDWWK